VPRSVDQNQPLLAVQRAEHALRVFPRRLAIGGTDERLQGEAPRRETDSGAAY
jgi:hypothetical protein